MSARRVVDLRLIPLAIGSWGAAFVTCRGIVTDHAFMRRLVLLYTVVMFVLWWKKKPRKPPKHARTRTGSILLGCSLMGACVYVTLVSAQAALVSFDTDPLVSMVRDNPQEVMHLRGVVSAAPEPIRSSLSSRQRGTPIDIISVNHQAHWVPSTVKIYVMGRGWELFERGDVVDIRGTIDVTFHGEPPFIGTLRSDNPVLVSRASGWLQVVRHVRLSLIRATDGLEEQARGLVPGMAVGDDRLLPDRLIRAMRVSSLSHLTAVSGSHIAILLGVVTTCAAGHRRIHTVATIVVLGVILALVGPEPSVIRSVCVAGIGAIAVALGRVGAGIASLSAAVSGIIVWDPWMSTSVGFALSVVATYAILGPSGMLIEWGRTHMRNDTMSGRICGIVVKLCAIPLTVQLSVLPILLLISESAPTWGVIANILAGPAVAPATIFALGATILAPVFPHAAHGCAALSGFFTGWVADVATGIASLPAAQVPIPGGTVSVVIAWVVSGLLLLKMRMKRKGLVPVA